MLAANHFGRETDGQRTAGTQTHEVSCRHGREGPSTTERSKGGFGSDRFGRVPAGPRGRVGSYGRFAARTAACLRVFHEPEARLDRRLALWDRGDSRLRGDERWDRT